MPDPTPMGAARLDEIRSVVEQAPHLVTDSMADDLLTEVDCRRAEAERLLAENDTLSMSLEEANELISESRLNLEHWRGIAAELAVALQRHVADWGWCHVGDDCDCSHTQAVMLLVREGALDGDPTVPEHPRPSPHARDEDPAAHAQLRAAVLDASTRPPRLTTTSNASSPPPDGPSTSSSTGGRTTTTGSRTSPTGSSTSATTSKPPTPAGCSPGRRADGD